jgi:hypothetical protein
MGSAAVGVPLGLVGAPESKQIGPAKAAAEGCCWSRSRLVGLLI